MLRKLMSFYAAKETASRDVNYFNGGRENALSFFNDEKAFNSFGSSEEELFSPVAPFLL
jgi:hypothetical protein